MTRILLSFFMAFANTIFVFAAFALVVFIIWKVDQCGGIAYMGLLIAVTIFSIFFYYFWNVYDKE